MKRHLLLFLLFACTTLGAQTNVYKVEDIPMVHLQDARRYVSNPDGILSEATVYAIDTTLYALERETGIQTLVVAVGQIEGGDCFDFAYRLGRENGVGRKETDNGLVILPTGWSSFSSRASGASSLPRDMAWKATSPTRYASEFRCAT